MTESQNNLIPKNNWTPKSPKEAIQEVEIKARNIKLSTANDSNIQFRPQLGLLGQTLKVNQLGLTACMTVQPAQRWRPHNICMKEEYRIPGPNYQQTPPPFFPIYT